VIGRQGACARDNGLQELEGGRGEQKEPPASKGGSRIGEKKKRKRKRGGRGGEGKEGKRERGEKEGRKEGGERGKGGEGGEGKGGRGGERGGGDKEGGGGEGDEKRGKGGRKERGGGTTPCLGVPFDIERDFLGRSEGGIRGASEGDRGSQFAGPAAFLDQDEKKDLSQGAHVRGGEGLEFFVSPPLGGFPPRGRLSYSLVCQFHVCCRV